MSEFVSKESFLRLLENRPYKFDEDEVGYRKAEDGEEPCAACIHFFERVKDKFHTCEIFRPTKHNESVNPGWLCRFQTSDGEEFPLLEE